MSHIFTVINPAFGQFGEVVYSVFDDLKSAQRECDAVNQTIEEGRYIIHPIPASKFLSALYDTSKDFPYNFNGTIGSISTDDILEGFREEEEEFVYPIFGSENELLAVYEYYDPETMCTHYPVCHFGKIRKIECLIMSKEFDRTVDISCINDPGWPLSADADDILELLDVDDESFDLDDFGTSRECSDENDFFEERNVPRCPSFCPYPGCTNYEWDLDACDKCMGLG